MYFRPIYKLALVILTSIFSIKSSNSQEVSRYAGKLVYVAVDPTSYSIDSQIVYYAADKILLINQPGEEAKTIPYRRIADLKSRKQFWILDSKKLILEDKLSDEYVKRKFEQLDGSQFVQNVKTRTMVSELNFPVPAGAGLEEYTMKVSVAGSDEPALVDEGSYLVDFGFFKGRLIMKRDSDAYFRENKDLGRKSNYTLMTHEKDIAGPTAALPSGYTTKPFSLHEFLTAFDRPAIDHLIRFYIDGSLKN